MARARAAVRGGATVVQLRLKNADARTLVDVGRALVAALPVPVIVNDRADVALACGAAGVHVGADDVPVAALRHVCPPPFVIGASVRAETAGADYVGIGPIFTTTSKANAPAPIGVDGFKALRATTSAPAVAIGGVTAEHVAELRKAGAAG
ncbi:MAG TPA: thiamine phosphate synthase, partial [Gemmatimonadaceae bacterium]|nr:thiamine phosphate synthase [Gemmatimonadaceae bacterium]